MAFDSKNFCKFMNKEGRAYQYRAMELINICRVFSVTLEQSHSQFVRLQSVLEACDTALSRASRSSKKTYQHTDYEIERAIKKLSKYEEDFHAKQTVETHMEAAKKKDEKNGRKDRITAKDGKPRVVRFHIFRSLPERNPIIVTQVLTSTSGLPEILWFFSHYNKNKDRLTLAQNPQFYEGPPTFPTTDGPASETKPTEDYKDTVYVLTNNERRVFLDLGKNRRIFDNIWRTENNTLIFKDVVGCIEREAIVGKSIPDLPLFWSRVKLPKVQLEAEVGDIVDWRAPIHDLLDSPRTEIHIGIKDHQATSLPPSPRPIPIPIYRPPPSPGPPHFLTPMEPIAVHRPPTPPTIPYYRPPTPPFRPSPYDHIQYQHRW